MYVLGLGNSFDSKRITCKNRSPHFFWLITALPIIFQDKVYVPQNGLDHVYDLGVILFRDLVSVLLI